MIGTHIGKYLIKSIMGEGGMGRVYLALDERLDREVAIKSLSPLLTADLGFRERFEREAKAMARLNHPGVVTVHDFIDDGSNYYIVMEKVDGISLHDLVNRYPEGMPLPMVVKIFLKILETVDYAHRQGVIHRDLKPANILVTNGDNVKVLDFGIAKLIGDKQLIGSGGTFGTFGTPHFMSPEQIENSTKVDHRADVYSMGIVLYNMLTSKVPFDGNSDYAIKHAHIAMPPPKVRNVRQDLPEWVDNCIAKALEKDPDNRYSGCKEFIREIEKEALLARNIPGGADGGGTKADKPEKIVPTRKARIGGKALVTAASLLLALLLVVIGVYSNNARRPIPTPVITSTPQPTLPPSIPTPQPTPSADYTDPVTGMEFVLVKAKGKCYWMGSPKSETGRFEGGADDETQKWTCLKKNFYMGKYEVTNKQFRKFRPGHDSKDYKGLSLNGDNQPVVYVSAEDADAFVNWLKGETGKNYKLPTEEQWEYACRAGTATSRYWGDDPDKACDYANIYDESAKNAFNFGWEHHKCDDGYKVTAPVGQFKPNNFGLYDMLGNVWVWTSSTSGGGRVYRGGSWFNSPRNVRCALRYDYSPGLSNFSLGFRLALEE
ncbi:MAG: SUMF1/EgtB/PvdO family nonheme iron enzyme [Nitrospirae bacterium]|nr:SUMF1/EgtB/PvdO family nonheme iron enzyme [Nitrospirota bacterium]